jgi:hypothetical protein
MPLSGAKGDAGHPFLSDSELGRVLINRNWRQSLAAANNGRWLALDAQAIFFRRRHQPRMPPLAKIRPGSPAPAIGPGTGAGSAVIIRA